MKARHFNPEGTSMTPVVHRLSQLIAAACTIGAFTVSFHALTSLAGTHGVPGTLAYVWAAVVDLTILGGTIAHMAMPNSRYALTVFITAAAVSIAGNVAYAQPWGPIGVAVAVTPPIFMLMLVHLCVKLDLHLRATRTPARPASTRPDYAPLGAEPSVDLGARFRGAQTRTAELDLATT